VCESRKEKTTYLTLPEYRADGEEQLEWSDDLALHEDAGNHRGRSPDSSYQRHVVVPLLEDAYVCHVALVDLAVAGKRIGVILVRSAEK
jgi:hypothetical protein